MMAISTETQALLNYYNQKKSLDSKQISQVQVIETGYNINTGISSSDSVRVYGPQELVANYNVPIKKIDNRIIELNTQIQNKQSDLLNLKQSANDAGCPGPVWQIGFTTTTVLQDNLNYVGYGFSAPNPFSAISGTLNTSNSGIGTFNFVSQSVIGSYLEPIVNAGGCATYVSQINTLNGQISTLQTERNELITKVNTLKENRISFELQNYAYTESKNKLNQQIASTNSIISFLEDPANEEWL
jgi:hypothetical protein